MKIRNYWLSVALSFLGIAAPALAQTGNTPQACKPEVKQIRDNRVSLVWNNVEPVYGIFDDFEGHPDFAINSPGELGWSYWDMDHARTYSIGEYVWQNQGSPMAFQIWNPSKTIPAYTYEKGQPHSGKKCLVSLATVTGERRNDWLISPDLRSHNFAEDITLSFWARSLNTGSGEELIKIAYSTTTMELSQFEFLNYGAPTAIPESTREHPEMYFYTFTIPQNARYVAINCVTWEGHALFIDDVVIATNKVNPTKAAPNYLTGFNLYRDGVKINRQLITEHAYMDTVPTFGDHVYEVESVFETGNPIKGVATTVNVPNIHLLPFVEDFISYDFETNFWEVSCPDNPVQSYSEPCFWSVNYRPYAMFKEAARFYPLNSLKDYKDYCLTSMELDATDLEGVMMCYDMGLDAYELTGSSRGGEAVAVEVFVDGEWKKVDERRDTCGDYPYTRFYVDLSQYVAHKKFNIRFNAQGRDAGNLIAWYIGYVRVYEKAKSNVSGTVLCGTDPVAGALVRLTSSQQDIYTAVTAADGTYSISDVDADNYTLTAELVGYNPYTQSVTIPKGSYTANISMTRPMIGMASASQSHTLAAEATDAGTISLQNTGNGGSRIGMWIDYQQKTVSSAPSFETLKTFNTSDILQASIGFDGEYFYMAQSDEYTNDALIYKYDREGTFVGTFMPDVHLRRWFAMAYDGENFYSVHADNIIRIINMKEGVVLGEIPTEITGLCHIAYDEARDAFWVGSLNTLALVDKNGRTLVNEIVYSSEEVLFSGSAYDPYFKEGPCLWIMDRSRTNHPLSTWTKAVIRRIDLTDMQPKDDYSFPCDQWPGFIYGGSGYGQVWGEGLFGTTRYQDGHFVLMGVIMSKPGLVGIVDMYEVPNWLKMDEYGFNMEASSSKQVTYTVDAANLRENDTRKAKVIFRMDPYATPMPFEVTANINAKAQYAKPLALRAVSQNDNAARLTWTVPQAAAAPTSYNIYRNGTKIASATALEYTDNNLKFGDYSYAVSAVYAGDHESALSNESKISIKVGVACYAPFGLTASNVRNNSIALTWKDPSAAGMQATSLRWDNGRTADGIMAYGDWIGAASWSAQDLLSYRNMGLKSVTFVPMTTSADFTLKIFENDVQVYSQKVDKTNMKAGSPFTVVLDQAYKINDRKELKVGIECANFIPVSDNDLLELGVDAGPSVNKKGNWMYMEGYGWFTVGSVGVSDANFNISLELTPKTGSSEPLANGYNVYRGGVKINTVTECSYTDPVTEPGIYTYTVTAIHDNGESYASPSASARIVDISSHDAPEDLVANISMNRNVSLHWNNPNTRTAFTSKSGEYKPFGYISHFSTLQPMESAVATDGKYIYTTHRNRNGEFHKYDMQGNWIEDFEIADAGLISDLTYDGTYFYGCGAGLTVLCFDFDNHTIVKKMSVTETARHITYIPDLDNGKGGFELGDWTSSIFVNKNGTYIGEGYVGLDGAFGAAYYNGKIYYSQQGSAGLCEVMEVDLATLKATGNSTDLSDSRYLKLAENSRSGGLGLFESANGTAVLVLVLQQPTPELNKIVFLEATQNAYVSGFNVYRDGNKINTEPVLMRDYADVLTKAGDYSYTVSAIYVDEVESVKSAPVEVTIVEPVYREAPLHVYADVDNRNVRLQWTSVIEMASRGDSMETYTHLATGKVGNWTTIDGDGFPVYVGDNFAFQGMDMAKTFFIVDEAKLEDRASGFSFSGNKAFVSIAAWDSKNAVKTDDWLITEAKDPATGKAPEWISFMARGLDAGHKENFYLAYSTMSSDTNNFIHITSFPERVDYLWTRYTYQLPEGVKYVAIHYTTLEGHALFIDDVCMGSGVCPFTVGTEFGSDEKFIEAVAGYNVYRNGERVNTELVKANSFFDGNLSNGEYTYEIQALYNTSYESAKSTPVKVEVKYADPCNAPEGLYADVVGQDVMLGWMEPFYDEPKDLTYAKSAEVAGGIGWTMDATYYVANKWDAADLMGVYGYRIDAVAGLFYYAPNELTLVIYQGGELMYEQDVTRECDDELNVSIFTLTTPYQIDFTKDLMVGFRIYAEGGMLTMLYVSGEADNGYGNLYSDDGQHWYPALSYSGGQWKGNWFMITLLDMGLPTAANDLQGYRMYRNGSAVSELISERSYIDHDVPAGTHAYQVAAVYGACGEKLSEPITVRLAANEGDEELNLVTVGPNPAHESVTVWGEYKKLEIVDVQGKVRLTKSAGNNDVIDIRQLPAGVYFVRIETNQGQQVRKLVVW